MPLDALYSSKSTNATLWQYATTGKNDIQGFTLVKVCIRSQKYQKLKYYYNTCFWTTVTAAVMCMLHFPAVDV